MFFGLLCGRKRVFLQRKRGGAFPPLLALNPMRIPAVTKWLLLLNVAAYIVDLLLEGRGIQLSMLCGLWWAGSPYFHMWQPLTYMFMHAGLMHLFFNMFALWMFGRIIEQLWGPKRFLLYYIVCGLGAGAVQEFCQWLGWIDTYAMTIGASGAVYGVLLAFGMCLPEERIFIIPIPFPIKAKYFVLIYAVIELVEGMSVSDSVAHFAHLGGMLFGFLLIMYWKREAQRRQSYRWQTTTSWRSRRNSTRSGRGNYGDTYDRYDRGEDDSLWNKFKGLFSGSKKKKKEERTRMHVQEGPADYTPHHQRERQESAEIDRILDKIRKGGYASLTEEEKARLFNASKQ